MGSSRRRAVAIAAVALILAIGAWIASAIVPTMRIDWTGADGRPGVSVAADLPAATCRKALSADFPWVRIGCEPRRTGPDEPGATAAPTGAPASPNALDTAQDAE